MNQVNKSFFRNINDPLYIATSENDDGSVEFDLEENVNLTPLYSASFLSDPSVDLDPNRFFENLVEHMTGNDLSSLAGRISQTIQDNFLTMKDWLKSSKKVRDNLGITVEDDLIVPFNKSAGVFDNSMLVALLTYFASIKSELFPTDGPCSVSIQGQESLPQLEAANKLEKFFNYYLTKIDEEYYPESHRLILNVGLDGSIFRKVFIDPITMMPVARTVPVKDLIFDNSLTSLKACSCITHKIAYSKKDVLTMMASGFYKHVNLDEVGYVDDIESDDGVSKIEKKAQTKQKDPSRIDISSVYNIYESHIDLSDNDFFADSVYVRKEDSIPRPYVVTTLGSGHILSIRRNWEMGDPLKIRKKTFIHYRLFPGFGLLGLGIGQIMGSNSLFITKIFRQILNAEAMRIFPRGIKNKNVEIKKDKYNIGPSEFIDVDTKGLAFAEAFQFLELPPSNPMMVQLLGELRERNNSVTIPGNERIPEGSFDAPVGTTLALLEEQHRMTSVIIQSLHGSLTEELMLLYKEFATGLMKPYSFFIQSNFISISPQDFNPFLQLVPTSNGAVSSFVHNLMKSEAIASISATAPDLCDMREVTRLRLEALGLSPEEIEKLMPPPSEEPQKPMIDPNEVLMIEVQDKMEMARKKHELDMLSLAIEKAKLDRDYVIQYQKMKMEYEKNGLVPPHPVNITTPDVPLTEDNEDPNGMNDGFHPPAFDQIDPIGSAQDTYEQQDPSDQQERYDEIENDQS